MATLDAKGMMVALRYAVGDTILSDVSSATFPSSALSPSTSKATAEVEVVDVGLNENPDNIIILIDCRLNTR